MFTTLGAAFLMTDAKLVAALVSRLMGVDWTLIFGAGNGSLAARVRVTSATTNPPSTATIKPITGLDICFIKSIRYLIDKNNAGSVQSQTWEGKLALQMSPVE
jgi:hypothetical protein